jgi:hypothetical protein
VWTRAQVAISLEDLHQTIEWRSKIPRSQYDVASQQSHEKVCCKDENSKEATPQLHGKESTTQVIQEASSE